MTDIILGSAQGFNKRHALPFVESLRRTGYAGEVLFFVTGCDPSLESYLRGAGVEVSPFQPDAETARMPINALRYFLYHDYLARHPGRYRSVMIADTRDVVFQRDPFAFQQGDDYLFCFLEETTIGSCPYNAHWIRGRYGEEALAAMKERTISCSGVTLGSAGSMLRYLEVMKEALLPPEETVGYDQGVHNHLLATGRLPYATLVANREGPVITLGRVREAEFRFNAAGELLNAKDQVVNTLHQYDRIPSLTRAVHERLGF